MSAYVLVVESGEPVNVDGDPDRGVDVVYGPMTGDEAHERRTLLQAELWDAGELVEPSVVIVRLADWTARVRLRPVENVVGSL